MQKCNDVAINKINHHLGSMIEEDVEEEKEEDNFINPSW